jgi:hypothetical protein
MPFMNQRGRLWAKKSSCIQFKTWRRQVPLSSEDMEKLIKIVSDNAENAMADGYEVDKYSDADLAGDMCAYAADCEEYDIADVTAAIIEWRKRNGRSKTA